MRPWKRGCNQCAWIGDNSEVLTAPNPFEQESSISGCPECKTIDDFHTLCDREGCWETASSGTPTEDGYKWLCYKHWKQQKEGKK